MTGCVITSGRSSPLAATSVQSMIPLFAAQNSVKAAQQPLTNKGSEEKGNKQTNKQIKPSKQTK